MPHRSSPPAGVPDFRWFSIHDVEALSRRAGFSDEDGLRARAAAVVFGFGTTSHVVEDLIDWERAPDDPVYRMVFPDAGLLTGDDVTRIGRLLADRASRPQVEAVAEEVRRRLVPVLPREHGEAVLPGIDRIGDDIVQVRLPPPHGLTGTVTVIGPTGLGGAGGIGGLGAPRASSARWPDVWRLAGYLREHPEVRCVQFTGTEPLLLTASTLRTYIEPLLAGRLEEIRFDTSVLACWPYRFLTDPDTGAMLRLTEKIVAAGKAMTILARFAHPRELTPPPLHDAVRRLRRAGVVIRTEVTLIPSVNDTAETLARLWRSQIRLGMVPYDLRVGDPAFLPSQRRLTLARAYVIFTSAFAAVGGLARTVRGPLIFSRDGLLCIDGITDIDGERKFVLHYAHGPNHDRIGRPFFAAFDPDATALDMPDMP